MSDSTGPEVPAKNVSAWTLERLLAFAESQTGQELERVREIALSHAYRSDEPRDIRLQWAMLSLEANKRLHDDRPWSQARMAQNNFMLRMWIIDELGPDDEADEWNPEALVIDTLAALTLDPHEARALTAHWRDLPHDQIGELRRHKNMTAHLDRLIKHLQPGPLHDQLDCWLDVRQHLP